MLACTVWLYWTEAIVKGIAFFFYKYLKTMVIHIKRKHWYLTTDAHLLNEVCKVCLSTQELLNEGIC